MDWVLEGLAAAMWQIAAFIALLVLMAAGMWSCNYLGINPGHGILALYVGAILSANLFLSWKSQKNTVIKEEQ